LRERHALTADLPSMRCVGYRQTLDYLDARIGRDMLRERGIAATRQLAKRQLTWLRGMDVAPLDCFAGDVIASVAAFVGRGLDAAALKRPAR
jgi:tRNA dimethylallyltransferase